jgi:hypothetical protein
LQGEDRQVNGFEAPRQIWAVEIVDFRKHSSPLRPKVDSFMQSGAGRAGSPAIVPEVEAGTENHLESGALSPQT